MINGVPPAGPRVWTKGLLVAGLVPLGIWVAGVASADPPPTPKTTIDQDGTYAVGTDIEPGTYTSAGPAAGSACYWKILNGSVIVDNALSKKPQVVHIDPGNTAFKTDHCQPWQKTGDDAVADAPPPQSVLNDLNDYARRLGSPQLPPR